MITEKYEIVIGIIQGYDSSKDVRTYKPEIGLYDMCNLYQDVMESNPILKVSATIENIITVYSQEWGSPRGGELCYKISCQRNPNFDTDPDLFRQAVLHNVKVLKKKLK